MLTLITSGGGSIPLNVDDYYIKELASGLDELVFNISIWDENYPLIQEESSIREESGGNACNYLVKAIDGGKETASVKAQIDLDDWKSILTLKYDSGSRTFQQIVNAVKPTGWSVVNDSGISSVRTIHMDAATPFDVLEQCRSTFSGATYRFDNINRIVTLRNTTTGTNLGAFVTRDLNLTENNYMGKSTGFATRLYAYGKNGLSFASINGNKPYVDDFTYSNRVICAYWVDERYTIAQNLLADARAKLAEMATPQRSYECSVVDLAKTNPDKYSELDFVLFSIVGLIDQTRSGVKINHMVVERWIYPKHPEQNKVVLSTVAPRIQSQVAQIVQSITNVNSDWSQQQTAMFDALSAAILGANGGSVRLLDTDNDGEPDTLYIADDSNPATATKVWRFNYEGWAASVNGYNGPFTLGATFTDGGTLYANVLKVINIDASKIYTGYLSADRIEGHSLNVDKIGGSLTGPGYSGDSNSWGINFQTGALTIGNVDAAKITAGYLSANRIDAHSLSVDKIGGNLKGKGYPADSDSWEINFQTGALTIGNITANNIKAGTIDASVISVTNLNASNITSGTINASTITITNLNASNITSGTLSANRISGHSLDVGKITGSLSGKGYPTDSNSWSIDFEHGTLTIGNINASNIKTGTLDASTITVSNLNATNITVGSLSVDRIVDGSLTGAKIGTGQITGGVDGNGDATGNIAPGTITGGGADAQGHVLGNLALGTIDGGVDSGGSALGNLAVGSVSYGNTSFTGTLDQVGTNQSDIAAINNLFVTTLSCNQLEVGGGFWWHNRLVSTVQISSGGVSYSCLYAT